MTDPLSMTQSEPSGEDPAPSEPRVGMTLFLAYGGGVTALTGVQLIVPALPLIQDELGLSDPQIGLVTSLFLLPSVLLSVPAGMLADRYGRRLVYSGSLALFGLGGLVLAVFHSVEMLFAVRLVQGAAFAALLPVTITLIGDVVSGTAQVRAQGHRNIVMAVGDSGYPLLGGALALLAWYAPFAVQIMALPLAVVGWAVLEPGQKSDTTTVTLRALGALMATRVALAIQAAGLLRFLFKFAILSYLPILLDQRDVSTMLIAASLSLLAGAGVLAATVAPMLVRRLRASSLVMGCLMVTGLGLLVVVVVDHIVATVIALLVLGFADVLYAVLQNALMVASIDNKGRASFIAATGAVRNLGKFAAPTVIGALILIISLEQAFLVLAIVAVLAIPTALPLRRVDRNLTGDSTNR